MKVYVDELRDFPLSMVAPAARKHGRRWCHLFHDGGSTPEAVAELVAFGKRIGLKQSWLQTGNPRFTHFDLTPYMRAKAVSAGATEIKLGDWLKRRKGRK